MRSSKPVKKEKKSEKGGGGGLVRENGCSHHIQYKKIEIFFRNFQVGEFHSPDIFSPYGGELNHIQFMGSKQYTDFAGRFARWLPSQKGGGRTHLASLPAKSVYIEKHPKWVLFDLPP